MYCCHSADRSSELPDLHTTQTQTREVHASVVTEWLPAYLLKLLPEYIKGQLKKASNKRCFQFINIYLTNAIQVLNLREFFRRYFCVHRTTFFIWIKKTGLVLDPREKDKKYPRDKANIDNPKVNRGCPSLTAIRTLAECMEITLGPSIQHILLGVYGTRSLNAMDTRDQFFKIKLAECIELYYNKYYHDLPHVNIIPSFGTIC